MVLMETLFHQKKSSVSTLVNQIQNFARVYIIIDIITIYLLMENKFLSLKPILGTSTFQLSFV